MPKRFDPSHCPGPPVLLGCLLALTTGCDALQQINPLHPSSDLGASAGAPDRSRQDLITHGEGEVETRLRERLVEAHRRYWPALPIARQQEQVGSLLVDEFPCIRLFGLERVGVLLRDGNGTPEIQEHVLPLLRDPDLGVRQQTALLLEELDCATLPDAVVDALRRERDHEVLGVLLDWVSDRPAPGAYEPALGLLADPSLDEHAAGALWSILALEGIEPANLDRLRTATEAAFDRHQAPRIAGLFMLVGTSTDARRCEALLDGDDDDVRQAVAEACLRRPHVRALLDRSHDPRIQPWVFEALVRAADLLAFRRLADLDPVDANLPLWIEAMSRLAGSLSLGDLLEADGLISGSGQEGVALRIRILREALGRPGEPISLEARRAILRRAVPLMLAGDDATEALVLFESLNDQSLEPDLASLKFRAAIWSQKYELAAALVDDRADSPASWIAMYEDLAEHDHLMASVIGGELRDEILRRYGSQLTAESREQLGAPVDPLIDPDGSSGEVPPTATANADMGQAP